MKRTLVLVLAVLMLVVAPGMRLRAEAAEIIDSGTCGANVTWTLDSKGKLTISGSGDMEDYGTDLYWYWDEVPWYSQKTSILSVVVEEGVTSIGGAAFASCDSLSSISLPASLTSIGGAVFSSCDILSGITIPEGVTSIGRYAFVGCSSLSSITLPESLISIGDLAFSYCLNLKTVHYGGTEAQREHLSIGESNAYLTDATWHYECDGIDYTEPENPFTDIFRADYYYDPVLWAVKENITKGMDETHFAPTEICSRGQVVTFLWRANGSPEPQTGYNPFRDVKMTDYFYKAVLWAVENGITSGVSADSFDPGAACTRGQVATFLWRSQGKPYAYGENIFGDIAYGAYYYDAVLWAVDEGITNGVGEGLFAPDATCTRGQIVTFLYRAMK